ncbi:hypothetical protein MLD38_029171 [Melastoma candidum]|uniref:Uncharacterized protein n=1 Tax=Melastoma candidum TaxID=119954 RepID=A0ACB9N8T7_9MYRT|nr:hypothetical protein MLD38_029171 [Melastoma candidum]
MVHDYRCYIFVYGFGFDPLSDDYKIVTIYESYGNQIVQIRGLKRDTWRTILEPSPAGEILDDSHRVHLNGILHWSALNDDGSIKSFDLHQERFQKTLLLPGTTTGKTGSLKIGVVGDCLSICMSCVEKRKKHYEVWMMKEYGVRSSWTIVFRMTEQLVPFALTGDGKIILDERGYRFHLYDPSQGCLSTWKAYTDKKLLCDRWTYQETLISPHTLLELEDESES